MSPLFCLDLLGNEAAIKVGFIQLHDKKYETKHINEQLRTQNTDIIQDSQEPGPTHETQQTGTQTQQKQVLSATRASERAQNDKQPTGSDTT